MVRPVQGKSGGLNCREGRGFGRERQGHLAHHFELRALGGEPGELIEHDVGGEARGGNPESGKARGVGNAALVGGREESAEPAARIDDAAPAVAELQALQLREGREEVARELGEGLGAVVIFATDAATIVIDRVVPAKKNSVVVGEPVVVELVGHIGNSLAALPPDALQLRRGQRLGHEHVVVDRNGVKLVALEQRGERVGGQRDAISLNLTVGKGEPDAVTLCGDGFDGGVLKDLDASGQARG